MLKLRFLVQHMIKMNWKMDPRSILNVVCSDVGESSTAFDCRNVW